MMFFDLSEFFGSVIFSLLFGIISGGIYKSLFTIKEGTVRLILAGVGAFRARRISFCLPHKRKGGGISRNVIDFLFFTLCGLSFILLSYLTLDGAFRIYPLILSVIAFFFSKKTLGTFFEKATNLFFSFSYRLVFTAWYILLMPLKAVLKLLSNLLSPTVSIIKQKLTDRKFARIVKKKEREISYFFKRAEK